jgi:hypothetical protein
MVFVTLDLSIFFDLCKKKNYTQKKLKSKVLKEQEE